MRFALQEVSEAHENEEAAGKSEEKTSTRHESKSSDSVSGDRKRSIPMDDVTNKQAKTI